MIERKKKKIAVIHPLLIPQGGSQARALWIVEALKEDYDMSIISMGKVNIKHLNYSFGTNINENQVNIISIPLPYLLKNRFEALKGHILARICKNRAIDFDLMISSYNIMGFGKKGIQFIADVSFDDSLRRKYHPIPRRFKSLFYRKSLFRKMYLKFGEVISKNTQDDWKKNLTIVNSEWSGKIIKDVYGIDTQIIYPPVSSNCFNIPWEERENGFVFIGRLVPEKKLERVVKILKMVKEMGWDIHLHILGGTSDSSYNKWLKKICEKNRDWVFLEGMVFGDKKLRLISKHRYGINGCLNEAFGISVAEMVCGGCIVWTPNSGGQVEIVNHPYLMYEDIDDAVLKIDRILKSSLLQSELRRHLSEQSKKFSSEKFKLEIRHVVQEFFLKNAFDIKQIC